MLHKRAARKKLAFVAPGRDLASILIALPRSWDLLGALENLTDSAAPLLLSTQLGEVGAPARALRLPPRHARALAPAR